jgi:hypothetical protein
VGGWYQSFKEIYCLHFLLYFGDKDVNVYKSLVPNYQTIVVTCPNPEGLNIDVAIAVGNTAQLRTDSTALQLTYRVLYSSWAILQR